MESYFLKTFLGGLMWERGLGKGYFGGEFWPLVKTEGKICWTYKRDKKFVVKVKRMWKDSKFKDLLRSISAI